MSERSDRSTPRPTLTVALSSVLSAHVEGEHRAGLLAVLRPDFGRSTAVPRDTTVVPLHRVIPLPTRPRDDETPDPAA